MRGMEEGDHHSISSLLRNHGSTREERTEGKGSSNKVDEDPRILREGRRKGKSSIHVRSKRNRRVVRLFHVPSGIPLMFRSLARDRIVLDGGERFTKGSSGFPFPHPSAVRPSRTRTSGDPGSSSVRFQIPPSCRVRSSIDLPFLVRNRRGSGGMVGATGFHGTLSWVRPSSNQSGTRGSGSILPFFPT